MCLLQSARTEGCALTYCMYTGLDIPVASYQIIRRSWNPEPKNNSSTFSSSGLFHMAARAVPSLPFTSPGPYSIDCRSNCLFLLGLFAEAPYTSRHPVHLYQNPFNIPKTQPQSYMHGPMENPSEPIINPEIQAHPCSRTLATPKAKAKANPRPKVSPKPVV